MESQTFRFGSDLQAHASPTALPVQRSRTLIEHRAVEGQLELLDPGLTLDGYVRVRRSLYGFWTPLEERLATTQLALVPRRAEQTASHWRAVRGPLRVALADAVSQDQAVNGALATFRSLRCWLAGQPR